MRLLLITAILFLAACARIPVNVDYRPGQDFSGFSHYYWQPPAENRQSESVYNSPLVGERVEQAVEQELLARGLLRTDQRSEADVIISYHIGVEDRVDIDSAFAIEGSYSKHRHGFGTGLLSTHSTDYKQSTLVIDFLAVADNSLLWRGMAERRLKNFENPAEHAAFLAETVAAVLAKYPPQP